MPVGNCRKGEKLCGVILFLNPRRGKGKQRKVRIEQRKTCVERTGWEMRCSVGWSACVVLSTGVLQLRVGGAKPSQLGHFTRNH